jgi:hypothetical protein
LNSPAFERTLITWFIFKIWLANWSVFLLCSNIPSFENIVFCCFHVSFFYLRTLLTLSFFRNNLNFGMDFEIIRWVSWFLLFLRLFFCLKILLKFFLTLYFRNTLSFGINFEITSRKVNFLIFFYYFYVFLFNNIAKLFLSLFPRNTLKFSMNSEIASKKVSFLIFFITLVSFFYLRVLLMFSFFLSFF